MRRAISGILAAYAASVVTLLALEAFLRLTDTERPQALVEYPPGYFVRDLRTAARATPGAWRIELRDPVTRDRIYDVTYTVDEFGKRVTPVAHRDARDEFVLFFGCSFAYGEGVEDDETLPYFVGALAPRHVPYNYAFHGGSPYDALARLEHVDFSREVAEHDGVGVYVYIRDHADRVNDAPWTATWHHREAYYERTHDGRFVRNGSYASARPWRTFVYQTMWNSLVLRKSGLARPFGPESRRLELTADALAAVAAQFARRFPSVPFYVVNYPTRGEWRLSGRLKRRGVRSLDYAELFDPDAPAFRIDGDGHPTPLAHRTLAEALVRDLGLSARAAHGSDRAPE